MKNKTIYSHPQSNRSILRSNDWRRARLVRRWQTTVLLSLCGLVCSFAVAPGIASAAGRGACARANQPLEDGDKDAPRARSLATIDRGNDACIQFYEVEPGEIIVMGYGPKDTFPLSAWSRNLKKRNMIDLYKALTDGEAAPAPLVDAQRKVDAARAEGQAPPRDEPRTQSGDQQDARAHALDNGEVFEYLYCDYTYDFTYCKTNRTGDSAVIEQHATRAEIIAVPYRGSIHLRLEYHNIWGWHESDHRTVLEGEVLLIGAEGSRKNRRGDVHMATDNGYHWVMRTID